MKYKVGDKITSKFEDDLKMGSDLWPLYESNGGWLEIRLVSDHGYRYVGDEILVFWWEPYQTFTSNDDMWKLRSFIPYPKQFKMK